MTLEEYVEQANGKPFVVCMDKFYYEDYFYNAYNTKEEALTIVQNRLQEAIKKNYSNLNLVYHAYDEKGRCIDKEIYKANVRHVGGDKNE